MNEKAFRNLSYGVYICTTWDEGRPVGCVANSAMQVTSTPAGIAVSINRLNYTNECIRRCGYFALCVMSEKSDPKLIGRFGFTSGRDTDKFEGFPYSVRGKLPVLDDGCAYFVCKVTDTWETKTHSVFFGEVTDADELKAETPMTYAYYHRELKGKTAKNAPTYNEAETQSAPAEKSAKWVCTVCGYEYDGDIPFEELPDDWVCPLCGMGKEYFAKK